MATIIDRENIQMADRTRASLLFRHAPLFAAGLAVLGILLLHLDTAQSIVAIWIRSETFAHGFVVIPLSVWLGWRQRAELAATTAAPWWPGLVAVLLAGALWFVMSLADVLGVKQFALAFMLQAAVISVLGLRVAGVLALPLAFLLFAVPAGEVFVPTMIDWTADFTVAALRLSGVPVYREGNFFSIPSGNWSVIEACSGVRYLIASVMVGVVYAAIVYRSWSRRIAFFLISILVPLVANWLRAYLIVIMAHLSNNKLAVGVDHLIYGWVFFGFVMLLLFWAGSFWSEGEAPAPQSANGVTGQWSIPLKVGVMPSQFYAVAVAAIAIAALWRPVEVHFENPPVAEAPVLATLPAPRGWTSLPHAPFDWRTGYTNFSAELREGISLDGIPVGIFIAFYRDQRKGRELITSHNALVLPTDNPWHELSRGDVELNWNGQSVTAVRSEIAGAGVRLAALRLYWIDGKVTSSDYIGKALLAWSKLRGHGDDSAVIVIYAPQTPGRDLAREAAEALAPAVTSMLEGVRGNR